jgi:tRNA(Met) C34 N-acetyltransferase TmcA
MLASFCRLLHFEDRQDDYWDQRNILFQDVAEYLPDSDVDAPTLLKELVTRKALSESEQNPVIRKMDVLRALKTDESRLFPANNLIKSVASTIPREQESEIAQQIIGAQARPVVIHADGGVGKSVVAARIGAGLPIGSVTVVYDCFGNGQ